MRRRALRAGRLMRRRSRRLRRPPRRVSATPNTRASVAGEIIDGLSFHAHISLSPSDSVRGVFKWRPTAGQFMAAVDAPRAPMPRWRSRDLACPSTSVAANGSAEQLFRWSMASSPSARREREQSGPDRKHRRELVDVEALDASAQAFMIPRQHQELARVLPLTE